MADGGFLVKFNGKEVTRCFSVSFDYDDWQYIINDTEKHDFPKGLKTITVEFEE